MPLYEYECESCRATFEVIQKFTDHSVDTCRTCGGKVRRLLSAPAIQFKGTGWYITDYARKGTDGSDKEKAGTTSTESSAATAPTSGEKTASTAPASSESKNSTDSTPTAGSSATSSRGKT